MSLSNTVYLICVSRSFVCQVSLRKQEIADRLNAWIIFNEKNKELCEWLTQMENKVAHNSDLNIEEMVEKLKKVRGCCMCVCVSDSHTLTHPHTVIVMIINTHHSLQLLEDWIKFALEVHGAVAANYITVLNLK